MLDGDPGQGKSLVTTDLVARTTAGLPWPDGAPARPPAPAIILNAEDDARGTLRARLVAAGADPARVHVWDRRPGEPRPRLPSGTDALDALVARTGARLLVLDPITAFLDPAVQVASDPNVRAALAPLADLADARGCAVILVRHLAKDGGGNALYRGLASIAFSAVCRLTWLIGPDPHVPRHWLLAQPKNNLDPPAPTLSYAIEAAAGGAARVTWLGTSPHTAADLAGPARRGHLGRAKMFLLDALRAGPLPLSEIKSAAARHDLASRTLRRAARVLEIESRRVGPFRLQTTWWLLPGQTLPEHVESKADRELSDYFKRLNAEHLRQLRGLGPNAR